MKGAGWLVLLGGALLAMRRSESSASGAGDTGASGAGDTGASGAGPYPNARRTGLDGRNAWAEYAREVEGIARADLRALGASEVEQIVGPHALAALALSETSGRNEFDYNAGNLRPVGSQPRARWPNGVLYRSFGSRVEGVRTLLELLRGRRYGPAWREMVLIASSGAAIEPLVGAWFAAIHDAGYTDGPPATDTAARERWLDDKVRAGIGVADLVSRALAGRPAEPSSTPAEPSSTPVDASVMERANAFLRDIRTVQAGVDRDESALDMLRRAIGR